MKNELRIVNDEVNYFTIHFSRAMSFTVAAFFTAAVSFTAIHHSSC